MDGILISWQHLLYISLILILFYVAELLLFLRKSAKHTPADGAIYATLAEQKAQIEQLQREIDSVKVRLATMVVQQQMHDVPIAHSDDTEEHDSPYSQAIRLAQSGADADKVAAQCGISRGEADLIVALYRTGTLH